MASREYWLHSGVRWIVGCILPSTALAATLVMTPLDARAAGGEIAYVSSDLHSIHLVQADGSGDRQLVSVPAGFVGPLAWTPDGTVLAYTQTNPPSIRRESQRIFLYDIRAGHATELNSNIGTYGVVAFFPDGKHLAAASGAGPTADCDGEVIDIQLDTGVAAPLITVGACLGSLQVAPDGAALITATSVNNAPGPTVQDFSLASGQPTSITDPTGGIFGISAALAPDNRTLAYVTSRGDDPTGQGELVVSDRDGSDTHVVWQGVAGQALRDVAMASDGTQVAVALLQAGADTSTEDLWVLGIDGNNPHKVATGRWPAWRPAQSGGQAP